MEDYHLHSLVDDLGVSLADAQSGPVVPSAVKRIAAWLSSQGKKLANDKDDPYIKAGQRLPETVPLRLMKHIGRPVMSGLRLPGDGAIGRSSRSMVPW